MKSDDITLHLINMTLPVSGLAYALLGFATVLLALRFRAWSAAVSCAGFTYIAAVKCIAFGWSLWEVASPIAPRWLDMLARFQVDALMVSAIFLVFFAIGQRRRRDPGSPRTP